MRHLDQPFRKWLHKSRRKLLRTVQPHIDQIQQNLLWSSQHQKFDPIRKSIIQNQQVLILGSGPSALDIHSIPKNTVLLVCKGGIHRLDQIHHTRAIDYYLNFKGSLERNPDTVSLLRTSSIRYFSMDLPEYGDTLFGQNFFQWIPDDGKDTFYLDHLFGRSWKQGVSSNLKHNSSGIRLLQMALFFGAKSIHLAGIDMNTKGYFWGENNRQKHLDIDIAFIQRVASKYSHVYSACPSSPIREWISHKPLE